MEELYVQPQLGYELRGHWDKTKKVSSGPGWELFNYLNLLYIPFMNE